MPGSTSSAFCATVRLGFLSLLSMIQLSRSVTILSRNSRWRDRIPLAERAFREFLDVAFVDERDRLELVVESVLDGHAHQALGAGDGNGLDADAGIEANLFLAALQHVFVEELDQLGALGRALLHSTPM